jgi:hypothetical protein
MQCTEVRHIMQQPAAENLFPVTGRLREHLMQCAACRAYARDCQFRVLLGNLPVPGPSAGFADRALAQAWAAGTKERASAFARAGWGLATAAILVLAVGLVSRVYFPGSLPTADSSSAVPSQVLVVAPSVVRQVDLLMVSARALPEATITLQLDENVELAGYPGRNSYTWPGSLVAGNNQLTLPVQLTGEQSGTITVAVEADGARKQMMFTVQVTPRQGTALLPI